MACSCTKRKVTKQAIRKSPPPQQPTTRATSGGKRVIHRVIR